MNVQQNHFICVPALLVVALLVVAAPRQVSAFTPTHRIPMRITGAATEYPSGGFGSARLIDGDQETEYASDNNGTNTFVEFSFPSPATVIAFRHVDRADRALVGESELIFSNAEGKKVGTVRVDHVNRRSGETFLILPRPMHASRVRWQVTRLGTHSVGTVGGAEVAFFSADAADAAPTRDSIEARALPFLDRAGRQPIRVTVNHPYLEPAAAVLRIENAEPTPLQLVHGVNTIDVKVSAATAPEQRQATLELSSELQKTVAFRQNRIRPMTVYILPHSHTDVGYTELQPAIEEKQVNNLVRGIELARRTADYPAGARYVWNVEVLWAADLYLKRLGEARRAEFLDAVKNGQVELNGMYLNELTALCRPEELIQLFRYATELSAETRVPIRSAMISDVPGYTWGTVTAMAQAGIRYLSAGPNYGERAFMRVWQDKPFYWVGPDRKSKVLVWISFQGYALSHIYDSMSPRLLEDLGRRLQSDNQPYEIAHIRWAGQGDNGVPDASLCDFVKDWNTEYASPQFVISGTTEAFKALEERYGKSLPEFHGDWTPYWEDGAGSTAHETALNRQSAERLTQAQTLFAMLDPTAYPKADFDNTWKNILLFSEHTWGALGSVSHPEHPQTTGQWAIKKSYADQGEQQSKRLVDQALKTRAGKLNRDGANSMEGTFDVINTLSWPRTELVRIPAELSRAGDRVVDASGKAAASQRLRSGELAFLAADVPAFGTARYRVESGAAHRGADCVQIDELTIENDLLRVRVDEATGGVAELRSKASNHNFAGDSSAGQLNQYIYLRGEDPDDVQGNAPVRISVEERGPLIASLAIESAAPGCHSLRRELRLIAGRDFVEVLNHLDKARLKAESYKGKQGKESVNFAFPFQVPDGRALVDLPLAAMRPAEDQIPASCTGWFTAGRWISINNAQHGITWVTLDAPLVQFEDPTEELRQWRPSIHKDVRGVRRIYSWVMNNRWGTNYRAYQEGPSLFRYVMRPQTNADPAEASRFATGFSQPLIVSSPSVAIATNHLPSFDCDDVLITAAKPADDGGGLVLRLFGASGESRVVSLRWPHGKPSRVYLSDTSERPLEVAPEKLAIPGFALVTLRAEFDTIAP
ncbi:MAG TPA: hypothetical protein VEH04_15725 [Verrucomicrobiae bacterium]|nr:hypothetical protein [Verrucomicrobiae bacterium]